MKIRNIDGYTPATLQQLVEEGGRFIRFSYTLSFIVVTLRRSSEVYFVKPGEKALVRGLRFTLLSFLLGWWGIPWGPVHTVAAIHKNIRGGKDITNEVMAVIEGYALFEESNRKNTDYSF